MGDLGINYQANVWQAHELEGVFVSEFFGLYNDKENAPEIIFLKFENEMWIRVFLDDFLGYLYQTEEQVVEEIIENDFAGFQKVDLVPLLDGEPLVLRSVACVKGPAPTVEFRINNLLLTYLYIQSGGKSMLKVEGSGKNLTK